MLQCPSGNARWLGHHEGVGCTTPLLHLNVVPDYCHACCREGAVLLAMPGGLAVLAKYQGVFLGCSAFGWMRPLQNPIQYHSLYSWTALPTMRWFDYVLHDATGSYHVSWW